MITGWGSFDEILWNFICLVDNKNFRGNKGKMKFLGKDALDGMVRKFLLNFWDLRIKDDG